MESFIDLVTYPPDSADELQRLGQEILTDVRKEYMHASQRYSTATKQNESATTSCQQAGHSSEVLLERHLSAERDTLCSEIKEIDSEEIIENRLARSRKLRVELQELQERKEALQKLCAEKRKAKKLEIRNHKRLREMLGVSCPLPSMAEMDDLPCPLYSLCCALISAKEWVEFDVEVVPMLESGRRKRMKTGSEGKASKTTTEGVERTKGPSIQVKIERHDGEKGTWVVRYSEESKLMFVDAAVSDSWVIDALDQIQPSDEDPSLPQLERCCYTKPNLEGSEEEKTEVEPPCAWRWLQELGGITEMPLLSARNLLGGTRTGHVLAGSLLKALHESKAA